MRPNPSPTVRRSGSLLATPEDREIFRHMLSQLVDLNNVASHAPLEVVGQR